MGRKLVVSADDYGLCEEITTGIIKAHTDGIVTSTSVVANGRYFEKGVALLKETGLDAGVHLTFTGGEKPVLEPVDGIVDEQGRFLQGFKEVVPRIISGRYDRVALCRELAAQVSLLLDSGIRVTHMDSHQHLHLLPVVRDLVVQLAERFRIRWVRVPQARGRSLWGLGVKILSYTLARKLSQSDLDHAKWNAGFEYSGRLEEGRLFGVLERLKNGVTELMVHPGYDASGTYGWGFAWESELAALTSDRVKAYIREQDIELTDFSRL